MPVKSKIVKIKIVKPKASPKAKVPPKVKVKASPKAKVPPKPKTKIIKIQVPPLPSKLPAEFYPPKMPKSKVPKLNKPKKVKIKIVKPRTFEEVFKFDNLKFISDDMKTKLKEKIITNKQLNIATFKQSEPKNYKMVTISTEIPNKIDVNAAIRKFEEHNAKIADTRLKKLLVQYNDIADKLDYIYDQEFTNKYRKDAIDMIVSKLPGDYFKNKIKTFLTKKTIKYDDDKYIDLMVLRTQLEAELKRIQTKIDKSPTFMRKDRFQED